MQVPRNFTCAQDSKKPQTSGRFSGDAFVVSGVFCWLLVRLKASKADFWMPAFWVNIDGGMDWEKETVSVKGSGQRSHFSGMERC